jgi:hypothetical protein
MLDLDLECKKRLGKEGRNEGRKKGFSFAEVSLFSLSLTLSLTVCVCLLPHVCRKQC